MRVHLVNPPAANGVDMVREGRCMQRAGAWTAVWAPISLATIAAVLEREGHLCRLDDCIIEKVDRAGLIERARVFSPELFVLNTATPSIGEDLATAAALKREFPRAFVIAIGIHVTALWKEVLEGEAAIDAIALGEPELTVADAARALDAGEKPAGLPGLAARGKDGLERGPERPPADLDDLPMPAWNLVRTELYRLPFSNRPFLLLGTSRGCPFHCEFCADPAYYGHALRLKSPKIIVDEIRRVKQQQGINDFLFWSESFTLKREWTMSVLDAVIESGLDVRFVVNSRVDHVDPELLSRLRQAGCWMIGFGLESGSDRVLGLMNKKTSVDMGRKAVAAAKQAGLSVTAHMVLGYPGETEDEARATIDLACSLPLDFAQFYCVTAFPGSRLFERALKEGLLATRDWARFEQNFATISSPSLPVEKVMVLRKEAYRRFYRSPRRIMRVLGSRVGLFGLPRFARMALSFREWM